MTEARHAGQPGKRELMLGNEAIARGAVEAGVEVAASYPGTPASEVLGTLVRFAREYDIYVEWSVNEKVALEVAAGAAFAGARSLAAMKQVGLNVASDPLMSLAYIGVKGGLVLVVADDPGPHSSQTEQDTRLFGGFAHLPVLDPSYPQEARDMTVAAFDLSEELEVPVIVRPTTRTAHAYSDVLLGPIHPRRGERRFQKDRRWVILPRLSYERHGWLLQQEEKARALFAFSPFNALYPGGDTGIIAGGVSFHYVREALQALGQEDVSLLKIGTPQPLPVEPVVSFLKGVKRVLVVEEQEPVLEDQVLRIAWQHGYRVDLCGKRTGHTPWTGEYNADVVESALRRFLGLPERKPVRDGEQGRGVPVPADLPVRPPVLCAGCPHRASFYAFKRATKGMDPVFTGDIGCYTLGYAPPLDAQHTCLCMGASITIATGLQRVEPDRPHIAFIGDSTFFHAGIPALINAVYNHANITVVILDNDTTAMTGHQPHPGLGRTALGDPAKKIDIEAIARACGVEYVREVDPNDIRATMEVAREAVAFPGPSVVIARAPCVAIVKVEKMYRIDEETCTDCDVCLKHLGCPSIVMRERVTILETCAGCGVCAVLCPYKAIREVPA